MGALLRNRPDLDRKRLERTRALMNAHTRDVLVTGYEGLIDILDLPDPDDRHVLAAAIVGRADVVITADLADFPAAALRPWGIEAQHPDEFLSGLFQESRAVFLEAVKRVRLRLNSPPKTARQ